MWRKCEYFVERSSVHKQVSVFLLTVENKCKNFLTQDVFKHSRETMSRHFHVVLYALAIFWKEMIKPLYFDDSPPQISSNMKYYLWCKDCILSLTEHILPIVPMDKTVPYKSGRKDEGTQNVMIVCSFYMCFACIWTEIDGSAHSWIFEEPSIRQNTTFPHSTRYSFGLDFMGLNYYSYFHCNK